MTAMTEDQQSRPERTGSGASEPGRDPGAGAPTTTGPFGAVRAHAIPPASATATPPAHPGDGWPRTGDPGNPSTRGGGPNGGGPHPADRPEPPAAASATGPPASPRPESLLLPTRSAALSTMAQTGWQRQVRLLSGGLIKAKPSPAEMSLRRAQQQIRRTFSRPMTVVVVQPKGGAGKTPTTIGLAAALGAHRGGYVVGWDDNETRGTLAVRVANSDDQRTTVWDLLRDLARFEHADARVGDLSHYVRSQGTAQFDALVSDDHPGNMAQIGEEEFRRIHHVLQRFYREIVIDTGTNVRSPNWQAAVNAADLIVVVSTYRRDVGYSASWVLDHLSETGRDHLVSSAVTVLTAADPRPDATVRAQLLGHFGARTATVVEIPYDPVIAVGGPMDWTALAASTRRAWVEAGAAVVSALAEGEARERPADHVIG